MAIKKLQNNFTTPEQSKRLLELGVPADSADMYYHLANHQYFVRDEYHIKQHDFFEFYKNIFYPCWSVGRLIEIIKICSDVPIDWTGGLNEEREILEVVDSTLYALCLGKHMDFSKLEKNEYGQTM